MTTGCDTPCPRRKIDRMRTLKNSMVNFRFDVM